MFNFKPLITFFIGATIIASFQIGFAQKAIIPKPHNPGIPLNSPVDDFAPSLSADGKTMVFNSRRDGQKYMDIYISHYQNGKWSTPLPIKEINSSYGDETPFLDPEKKFIIFASDRDGSYAFRDKQGKIKVSYDLYISKKQGNNWSQPVKLPGQVNTAMHERAPSLSLNGKVLFYTSWPFQDRKKSRIMMSQLSSHGFARGVVMPAPINSGTLDMALIHATDGFYFSSARPGGYGGWDIYFVSFKKNVLGTRAINLGPLVNSQGNEIYYSKNNNTAFFCSNRKGGLGRFDIYRAGFDISNIYFDHDSAQLKKESYKILDEIFEFMKQNDKMSFNIIGHTDLYGTVEYNLDLSQRRAQAVKDYLVKKGLSQKRFKVRGAGKSEPVINKTGKGHDEKNRRTEFRVLHMRGN